MRTQIEQHEKAIEVLQAIDRLTNRIFSSEKTRDLHQLNNFWDSQKHYAKRVEIDTQIKERLQRYYNNNFNIKN